MTTPTKLVLGLATILVLGWLVGTALHKCTRNPEPVTPAPAEVKRQKAVNADSIRHAGFLAGEAKGLARYRALQADSANAASKDKQATTKAQYSANVYLKTPTLANCDTALTDCKEEVAAKVEVIASRDKMLLAKDSTLANRMAEIERQVATIDTLGHGWLEANKENAELTRKNAKKWAIGIQAGYGATKDGLSPCISIGVQRNLFRF